MISFCFKSGNLCQSEIKKSIKIKKVLTPLINFYVLGKGSCKKGMRRDSNPRPDGDKLNINLKY